MRELTAEEALSEYDLPELPMWADEDDTEARNLILYRFNAASVLLTPDDGVSLADAQDYCSQPETHGDGWFVSYDRRDA